MKPNLQLPCVDSCTIAVIGLGYVGLPLAVEFSLSKINQRTQNSTNYKVIGFDISQKRIASLQSGTDETLEVSRNKLQACRSLYLTSDYKELIDADVFIVTVPTPIDNANKPDMTALGSASKTIGEVLSLRKSRVDISPIIIYESTVYPGATEEYCIPIVEKNSGLCSNQLNSVNTFYYGYSPERVNPGDKVNTVTSIIKVTSGSNEIVSTWIDSLYASIISAGTFRAANIKTAEASKVIENTQRDLNIALINEISIICQYIGIDTFDVLEAARTKWNFLDFRPGLVGGHCIGVDPWYLTYKSEILGYYPQVVLSGRRINDEMGIRLATRLIKEMARRSLAVANSNILVLGLTFKENCPDIRNTRVKQFVEELESYTIDVSVVDPLVSFESAKNIGIKSFSNSVDLSIEYDCVVLAVAHKEFVDLSEDFYRSIMKSNYIIMDLKNVVPKALEPIKI